LDRTGYNIGLASMPADGINLSIWNAIEYLFGLKVHQSAFVIIFGFGFAIGQTFGLKRLRIPARKQAPFRYMRFNKTSHQKSLDDIRWKS